MTDCHCAKMIYGIWVSQLPPAVLCKLAGQTFSATTYKAMFKEADDVYLANGGAPPSAAVVAAVAAPVVPTFPHPSSAAAAATPQVAATTTRGGRGQFRGGRGQRGNRGGRGGRGNSNSTNTNTQQNTQNKNSYQPKPHQRGPKAAPDVPNDACARHWKEGRNATYCSDPLVCSWSHIIVPRK